MRLATTIISAIIVAVLFEVSFFSEIPDFDYSSHTSDSSLAVMQVNQARLPFIENQGQVDDEIKFYANTFAGTIYVAEDELVYRSIIDDGKSYVTKERFLNGNLSPLGVEKSQSIINYFKDKPENWKTNVPTWSVISLGQVWPSIEVDLKAYGNNVEKIFTVLPGGSVSDIKTSFDGVSRLQIAESGQLVLDTELGTIKFSKPIAYQILQNQKMPVEIAYILVDEKSYGFSVGAYRIDLPLVIDPLIASTFVGGDNDDQAFAITRDSSGHVFITGQTFDSTSDYPSTSGVYDTTNNGNYDVFVSKLNGDLSLLSASTFIGASGADRAFAIVADSSDNIFVTGDTLSAAFPTTVGAYNTTAAGSNEVFVSKFNNALTSLSASTFLGGTALDSGRAITTDSSGNVYVTGLTNTAGGTNFPTTSGAYDETHNGSDDVFVSKLNNNLTSLLNSTFVGGASDEVGYSIVLDSSGNVYITGYANSGFPTTAGAYDNSSAGAQEVYVSKLNNNLTSLLNSTFVGGDSVDVAYDLALDSSGNVYITGETQDGATDYPVTTGAYDTTLGGSNDAFVSKLNSNLSSLLNSTYIGGSGFDRGLSIAIDSSGKPYIAVRTTDAATDYPVTTGAYDTTHNGMDDVAITKLDSNLSSVIASTFVGGSANDRPYGMLLDSSNNVFVAGETDNGVTDYPVTTSAYDTTQNGLIDVFVSFLDCNLSNSTSTCATLTSGGSVSIPVSAGGTANATLPSGNTLTVTLPAGVSGFITITDTDSGSSNPNISFLGDIVDITPEGGASCSAGCTISFTFTGADAAAAGYEPSEISIYHDSNENGSFEAGEDIETTVSGSDPYTATGTASFTSKFAVGGIRANVAAAAQSLSTGGYFGFLDSCDPDGFARGQSLRVYEISYDKCDTGKMQVLAYSTCGPVKAEVITQSGRYTLGISSTQPFLAEEPKKLVIGAAISSDLESFNILIKDKRDSFTDRILLNQCSATKSYKHTTGYTSEQQSPIFYGEYDTEMQDKITNITPSGMEVEPEPNEKMIYSESSNVAVKQKTTLVVNPELTETKRVIVDPEPTAIVDPEPTEARPIKTHKNSIFDALLKSLSKIFQR
ncbi:MAG: SBBP repeat-containing protein [Thermoproteota archaeon]